MVISKSLFLLGFWGEILIEVMTGSPLVRMWDWDTTSFSLSQEKFKKKDIRMVQEAIALMTEPNPPSLIFLNERIEVSLLSIDIFRKQVDLFCDPSLMGLIICTFDIDPGFSR
jgi:hypothetical protein